MAPFIVCLTCTSTSSTGLPSASRTLPEILIRCAHAVVRLRQRLSTVASRPHRVNRLLLFILFIYCVNRFLNGRTRGNVCIAGPSTPHLFARNGRKPLFGRFRRPEMAANLFLVVSGDPKWPRTTFWSFRVTRNGCKPLFGRFRRPEMAANLFLVVSGEKMRSREPPPHLFKR